MGWTCFSCASYTKDVVAAHLARPDQAWTLPDGRVFRAQRYSVVGSELWILLAHESETGAVEHGVARYLLQGGGRGEGWGYKDVPVREGDTAPAYILSANLDPEYYGEWVAMVRAARAEKRARAVRLIVGMTVKYGDHEYRLDQSLGRNGWMVTQVATGARYRMKCRQVSQATVVGATSEPCGTAPAPAQMELAA